MGWEPDVFLGTDGRWPDAVLLKNLKEDESRRYVPADGGKLTAEQVMSIAGKHQPDYCSDTHACFDWQAIADELNAALGGGECEFVIEDNMNESEGMGDVWFRCTNCNTTFDYHADDWLMKQNYCPKCGKKVKR